MLGLSTATETLSLVAIVLLIGGWWSGLALASAVAVVSIPLELIDASHSDVHRAATSISYLIVFALCEWASRAEAPRRRSALGPATLPAPPAVQRWVRAAWWVFAAVLVLHIGLLAHDVRQARDERSDFENAMTFPGTVVSGGTTDRLRIGYAPTESSPQRIVIVPVWSAQSPPNGSDVLIDLPSPGSDYARLTTDRFEWFSNLSGYPTPLLLALALAAGRLRHRRLLQRLQRTDAIDVTVRSLPGLRRGGRSRVVATAGDEHAALRCPPRSPMFVTPTPAVAVGSLDRFAAVRFESATTGPAWPTARRRGWTLRPGTLVRLQSDVRGCVQRFEDSIAGRLTPPVQGPQAHLVVSVDDPHEAVHFVVVSASGLSLIGAPGSTNDADVENEPDRLSWEEVSDVVNALAEGFVPEARLEHPPPEQLARLLLGPTNSMLDVIVIGVTIGAIDNGVLGDETSCAQINLALDELGPPHTASWFPGWRALGGAVERTVVEQQLGMFGRTWERSPKLPDAFIDDILDGLGSARTITGRILSRRDVEEEVARYLSADPWPFNV